jgi:hypothetical protein
MEGTPPTGVAAADPETVAAETVPSGSTEQADYCPLCGTKYEPRAVRCKCGAYRSRARRIATDVFWLATGIAGVIGLGILLFNGWRQFTSAPVMSIAKRGGTDRLHLRIDGTGRTDVHDVTVEFEDPYLATHLRMENATIAEATKGDGNFVLIDVQFGGIIGSKELVDGKADILAAKANTPVVIRARFPGRSKPLECPGTVGQLHLLISAHLSGDYF